MSRWFSLSFLLALLVGIDRVTKIQMIEWSADSGPLLFPGILELVHHHNFGIIANLPVPQILIVLVTLLVIVGVVLVLYRSIHQKKLWMVISLTILLAGAIGNLWDRLQWGFVFDWILLFGHSAINLADIFIAVGLVGYVWERRVEERRRNAQSETV